MEEKKSSSSSAGIGFFGVLAILFIALKLTGVIAWSWWWVLAPLWGPLAFFIGFILIGFPIVVIVQARRRKKEARLAAEQAKHSKSIFSGR